MISRSCLVLVFVLGLPAALCAQKQQGSWSDLRGLRVGQGIVVIESSMKHHDGEFVSVTDEVLTLQEKGSDVSVKREDVVRVSTASGARRGEHAVIGLVVGGLIGAGIGAASGSSTGFLGDLRAESPHLLASQLAPRAGLRWARRSRPTPPSIAPPPRLPRARRCRFTT